MLRKKLTASFLSLVLAFGSIPAPAFAEATDDPSIVASEEEALLEDLETEAEQSQESDAAQDQEESVPEQETEQAAEATAREEESTADEAQEEPRAEEEAEAEAEAQAEAQDADDKQEEKDKHESAVELTTMGTGSVSLNAQDVTIYGLGSLAREKIGGLPADRPESFKLEVTGGTNPVYQVYSGSSVVVSDSGLIEPAYTTYYKYGSGSNSYWSTVEPSNTEGIETLKTLVGGTSTIKVYTDQGAASVEVTVVDYGEEYFNQALDDYIEQTVTPDMSVYKRASCMTERKRCQPQP